MDMVAHAEINNLSFVYADENEEALQHISLSVQKGEFIALAGGSGSGKTTLLKHFKKELLPIGKRTGDIYYDGTLLENVPDLLSAQEIGMVFQNPEKSARNGYGHSRISIFFRKYRITISYYSKTNSRAY